MQSSRRNLPGMVEIPLVRWVRLLVDGVFPKEGNMVGTDNSVDCPRNPGVSAVGLSSPVVTRVFIPLITPFLYGMERGVIELFDSLRPGVEPYFIQSNRIYQRQPPIIREMMRRG